MFVIAEEDEESQRVDLAVCSRTDGPVCPSASGYSTCCLSHLLLSCNQYNKSRVCKSKLSHLLFIVP